jgi:hypothetical protein
MAALATVRPGSGGELTATAARHAFQMNQQQRNGCRGDSRDP